MVRLNKKWLDWPETKKLAGVLPDIRFVGGCVRDALLGREVSDVDCATPLTPVEVTKKLKKANIKVVPTGIDHGTVTAVVDGTPFEITTLRKDVKTDGRHAVVTFTDDWQADAARRDFTMNAMFMDRQGKIYDYFDGKADVRKGVVRFVGNPQDRIQEDYLRLLRFFRFYAWYGAGVPDRSVLKVCKKFAPKLSTLSGERLRQELFKLLKAEHAGATLQVMKRWHILKSVLPDLKQVAPLHKLIQLEGRLKMSPDPVRRLAATLKKLPPALGQTLKLSKAEKNRLKALFDLKNRALCKSKINRALYYLGQDLYIDLILLRAARAGFNQSKYANRIELARKWKMPPFPLTGEDVTVMGYKGEVVGTLLQKVELWWVTKNFKPTRAACLHKLKKLVITQF